MLAANTGDFSLLRAFGAFFMIDMFLRLFAGQRFVPSLRIADFLVRKQRPEWVDAKPKQTAWTIGLVMVIIACFMMGWLGMRDEVVLALCGLCMSFLFAEAAFGFCAGCWLHQRFAKEKPQLCSGDVCQFEKEGSK
jgi:quinol-cytochrome oxidoreductase complex cytochrome b subunit